MSDRDDFVAAIAAALPQAIYRVAHRAQIVKVHEDDTVDVTVTTPEIQGSRAVPIRAGIPGARLLPRDGDTVRLTFERGSPEGAFAFGFDQDPGADRGIARENDPVDCGYWSVAPAGVGAYKLVRSSAADPLATRITGVITGGSVEVKLR